MKAVWMIIIAIGAAVSAAQGEYLNVGAGMMNTGVIIRFSDGAIYAFSVRYDDPNTTGIGLFDIIQAGSTLETDRQDYGELGWFINRISYEGHSNVGCGGGENWWHYWNKDSSQQAWFLPWTYGASSHYAVDGGADGWVYGDANEPRLPGDVNGDLKVNINDLGVLSTNWNAQSGMDWAHGDFGGDGKVDIGDLGMLAGNWGFIVSASPAPVPEPAVVSLIVLGLAVLIRNRRGFN